MRSALLVLTAIVLMASCRSTKKIQTAIAKKDSVATVSVRDVKKDSIEFINKALSRLKANKIDFTTFTAKINVDYRDAADKNYDVNVNLRMYKDSAIWLSVNAILGIEGLRALITKDSVKLLDKQNKVYTARSVDYLQEVTALPLDLATLQDLFIGNPVFLDSNIVSYTQAPNTITLLSIGRWFRNFITLTEENMNLQRSRLDDADVSRNRTADLTYSEYENKKGVPFATGRRISVTEKKKLDIKLEFKQYEFNEEVSFPFSIPKNYKSN